MRHARPWLSIVPVAALLACTATQRPPPDTSEEDAAAIRASSDSFMAAYNAADPEAFRGLYDEDVIQMPPDGPPIMGPDAIIQDVTDYFGEFTATQTSTVNGVSVHGDIGVSYGVWSVHETPKAGGAEQERTGKWLVVHRRQADGSWRIWRWMWNQEPAPSAGS